MILSDRAVLPLTGSTFEPGNAEKVIKEMEQKASCLFAYYVTNIFLHITPEKRCRRFCSISHIFRPDRDCLQSAFWHMKLI